MAFTGFLALFAVVAAVAAFVIARRRTGLGAAAGISALVFLGVAGASIVLLQVIVGSMGN